MARPEWSGDDRGRRSRSQVRRDRCRRRARDQKRARRDRSDAVVLQQAGRVVGLFGTWAATRLTAGLIYGVQPHDIATLSVTTLALGSIGCLACVVPALKAALVDPVTALCAE
jgi:hypothetical protein